MPVSFPWITDLLKLTTNRRKRHQKSFALSTGNPLERFEDRQMLSAHIGSAGKVQAAKTLPDYSGHWATSEGPMDITQNGKKITAVVTPPDVGDVHGTAKVRGDGSLKGKVTFDLDGTKTIVKYTAHLDPNNVNKMAGSYDLTFVGITHYTYDFTATRASS